MTRTCPACSEPAPDSAAWCEACGADLESPSGVSAATSSAAVATEPCVACGAKATEITADGWCQQCGQRQPSPRDHEIIDHRWVAGASDKGKTHHQNEDAMAIWVGERAGHCVVVVCDGVSSTELPDEASAAAAAATLDVLQHAAHLEGVADADFAAATEAAKAQVAAVWRSSQRATDPPSCTLVAATTKQSEAGVQVRVAWLGDSRAYWLGDGSAQLLTRDHSWAEDQRKVGTLDEEAIANDPRAHSITRWIGLDAGDVTPEIREFTFETPGRLVVCSDGLWNYAAEPDALGVVVAESAGETEAELVEALASFANAQGGHDNITVVTALFEATPASSGTPETAKTPDTARTAETGEEGSG